MRTFHGKGLPRTPFRATVVIPLLLVLFVSPNVRSVPEFREEPLVNSWARELGEKLYEISQSVTRADKIEEQYRKLNATVEAKDGRKMLDQIVERINGMLRRKADAVKCIAEKVEELAEKFNENDNNQTSSSGNNERFASSEKETDELEQKDEGRRDEDGGEDEEEDDGEEDEDDIMIEFSYHSAKCSQVEFVIEDYSGDGNGTIYREENSTCENEGYYRPMRLKSDPHFYNIPVNANHSAVHVPTNVYDQARYMLQWIDMSEDLDEVFIKNYKGDPSLSWQYFGSSVGYLRHFPAMKWKSDPDLFDCRGRPWYVEAASACTKSAVVLVDISGSMTGMRFSIARLTTGSLLETFAPNDLVSVITFSKEPESLVPCFKDNLVPATRENILAFKSALSDVQGQTEGYANFTAAFAKAFELLELNRVSRHDCSSCGPIDNEVLFLVTDNVPGNWSTFFETYNSPFAHKLFERREVYNNDSFSDSDMMEEERNENSMKDKIVSDHESLPTSTSSPVNPPEDALPFVRIVAYLIGKEVFNLKEIEKFTCENRGFSVNLQSLDEVKEEVLEYVPLLATPLALSSAEGSRPRPVIWTHTFADVADPKISRWLWEVMKSGEQLRRFDAYERNKRVFFNQQEEDRRYVKKRIKEDDESLGYLFQEYRLMTSVSTPAFLRRMVNTTNDTEVVADLLGVAGTDIPIDEFIELLHPHEIGVNGYGFAVTTEGNIIFHPDLRPVFQGSLKDGFNSVDLTEIEVTDDGKGPREFSEELLKLRDGMINQEEGEILGLDVLKPLDNMRRLTIESRNYYYTPLEGTPYSIALSIPTTYGLNKVVFGTKDQIKIFREKGLRDYFNDDNWKLHREWVYCKYLSESFQLFESPEERLLHFLEKISQPNWQWHNDPRITITNSNSHCRHAELASDVYVCDKSLIELLLFDAKITSSFFKTKQWELNNEEEKELFRLFNITIRFIATHSGLTRWQKTLPENENITNENFAEYFSRSIDESWYKQSVIWYQSDPSSYVYTMQNPEDSKDDPENDEYVTQVTATRAIYIHDADKSAPASVVGYQFPQSVLEDMLVKITSDYYCSKETSKAVCDERKRILKNFENMSNNSSENQLFSSSSLMMPSCTSGDVICYILDGSGYILAVTTPETNNDTTSVNKYKGQFFGKVEPDVMGELVDVGLYTRHPYFDYQGVCIEETITSRASLLLPFYTIQWAFQWAIGQILLFFLKTNLHTLFLPKWTYAAVEMYDYDEMDIPAQYDVQEPELDWRGRKIGKDDEFHPKPVVTIIRDACDKWAYRFSLTPPPPPPPTTEIPTTTLSYNDSDIYDDLTTTSNYSDWTTIPTSDSSVFSLNSTSKSSVDRIKRDIESSTEISTADHLFNDSHSSTTEDYDFSIKVNVSEEMENQTYCVRPFTAERIPHSDLVLVVVSNSESHLLCGENNKANEDLEIHEESDEDKNDDEDYWSGSGSEMQVELKELIYNDTHACHKLRIGKLPRGKRSSSCITQHPKERMNLLLCSGCSETMLNSLLMVLSLITILMNS